MAGADANTIFIKELREQPLHGTHSPYFKFVNKVIRDGTYEELSWLLSELERVISGLQTYITKDKPIKYYRIKQPENRANINYSLRYDILKRDNFHCKICGRGAEDGIKLHVDHIKPFSKGGKTKEDNLRALCQPCNAGKKDKYE